VSIVEATAQGLQTPPSRVIDYGGRPRPGGRRRAFPPRFRIPEVPEPECRFPRGLL